MGTIFKISSLKLDFPHFNGIAELNDRLRICVAV
jgi:hypothetical protein